MGKRSGPRRGSLAYSPRKRAKRIYGTVRSVPTRMRKADKPAMCAFACYKAGMTNIVGTDTYEKSPAYGQKISVPVTIFDCPPLFIWGIRGYKKTPYGLKTISDVIFDKLDKNKDLLRVISLPKKYDQAKSMKKIEDALAANKINEIRLLVHTQPRKIKLKKTPEIMEIAVTGKNMGEVLKYCLEMLGKEIPVSSVFKDGDFADAVAITKGKGTQGPVKRWGIKIQRHKAHGHRRFPGSIGAWTPSRVLWTVPMAGQMGFQRRTDVNKRILKVGDNGKEVTPQGGFVKYGVITGDYMLVKGSIPGPRKRLIIMKHAIRKSADKVKQPLISVDYISLTTQQGLGKVKE